MRALACLALLFVPALVHAQAQFPEMPQLETLAPPESALFVQETWAGVSQHCWEWGFPESARPVIEASLRERIRALGWSDLPLDQGTMRRDGAVIALARGMMLDRLDPSHTVLKLAICTEYGAPPEARAVFFGRLAADPLWPALPFGDAHTGWRRDYANGAHAIGLAFQITDEAGARAWLERAGYIALRTTPSLELRAGRARARFGGTLMWWQHEDRAP